MHEVVQWNVRRQSHLRVGLRAHLPRGARAEIVADDTETAQYYNALPHVRSVRNY